MTPIIDTHAHLCDPVFDADREAVMARARQAGVTAVVLVSETLADAERNLVLAKEVSTLHPAAGLYPENLDPDAADAVIACIRAHRSRLVAIGEVGLDHWLAKTPEDREIQRAIFDRFIHIAAEMDLPLNVHSRSAGKAAIDQLLAADARRVQLHAFDAKAGSARVAVEAGFFFSIPPSVVRSRQKQKLVKALPLSALLLETDSPVLGPEPGTRNEPANIRAAVDAIADIKGIHADAVIEAAAENTRRLYGPAFFSEESS